MSILETRLNPHSAEFASNRAWMLQLVAELEERQAQAHAGGGERSIKRFSSRGKLLPRKRPELLLDPGTPFMELSPLAAYGMYNDECRGASQITGIGVVSGVECMIFVNDATIKGGAVSPITLAKSLRAQRIAEENVPDGRTQHRFLALITITLAQWLAHSQLETNRGYWRNNPNRPQLYRYTISPGDEPVDVYLTPTRHGSTYKVKVAQDVEDTVSVEFNEQTPGEMVVTVDGHRQRAMLAHAGNTWWVQTKNGEVAGTLTGATGAC
ncbi:MAG: hypothetical protein M3Y76_09880 [Chloroflexota bacterium]|nr:hypothetical protein [Chloroflexota bacterium]